MCKEIKMNGVVLIKGKIILLAEIERMMQEESLHNKNEEDKKDSPLTKK